MVRARAQSTALLKAFHGFEDIDGPEGIKFTKALQRAFATCAAASHKALTVQSKVQVALASIVTPDDVKLAENAPLPVLNFGRGLRADDDEMLRLAYEFADINLPLEVCRDVCAGPVATPQWLLGALSPSLLFAIVNRLLVEDGCLVGGSASCLPLYAAICRYSHVCQWAADSSASSNVRRLAVFGFVTAVKCLNRLFDALCPADKEAARRARVCHLGPGAALGWQTSIMTANCTFASRVFNLGLHAMEDVLKATLARENAAVHAMVQLLTCIVRMGLDVALNVWPSCRSSVVAWGHVLTMKGTALTTTDVLEFIAGLHGLMPSWHCSVRHLVARCGSPFLGPVMNYQSCAACPTPVQEFR